MTDIEKVGQQLRSDIRAQYERDIQTLEKLSNLAKIAMLAGALGLALSVLVLS